MSKQLERLWALDENKQARLLDPAEDEFVAYGFEEASLNRILASARMSKGHAYYYISGKSDLYQAVCSRRFNPLFDYANQQADALIDTSNFWRTIATLIAGLAGRLEENKKLSALAFSVYGSPSAAKSLTPLTKRLDDIMERIVRAGQDLGEVRTDIPNDLIMEMLKGLTRSVDKWFALNSDCFPPFEMQQSFQIVLSMVEKFVKPTVTGPDIAE